MIEITPIKLHIGATVQVDRSNILEEEVAHYCLEALEKHTVLVFPRLDLSDEEQLALTDRLGGRVNFNGRVPGSNASVPDVYKVTLDEEINTQPEYVLGTFFWHMDGVTVDIPPPKATLLSARRLAPKGGQTEFASTYAAYEHLPEAEKAELAGLRARHSVRSSLRPLFDARSEDELSKVAVGVVKEHPIVWTHRSGRKSLVIGSSADLVVGMPVAHGRALLTRLVEWAAQPDFTYRHDWQEGDLVIWDNPGALHRVVPYTADSGRTMHRTSIAGTDPVI